jgi:ADP-ribose pyrophosphatase
MFILIKVGIIVAEVACMTFFEETVSSQEKFRGKIVRLRHDEILVNQRSGLREVVEHPGGVCVLAITQDQHVLTVDQFRYAQKEVLKELPAGKKEPNEEPLFTAQRELLEETGYTASLWQDLGVVYPSPAYLDEVIHLYVATNLTYVGQHLDDGEYLSVYMTPINDLLKAIVSGQIKDSKTAVLVMRYALQNGISIG